MSNVAGDRKAELERKKARLAAIREEKRRREEVRRKNLIDESGSASPLDLSESEGGKRDVREEAEAILRDLEGSGFIPPAPATPPRDVLGDGSGKTTPSHTLYKSRGLVNLQTATAVQVNIAPRENVVYNKTTQTISDSGETVLGRTPGDGYAGLHSFEWDDEFSMAAAHAGTVGTPDDADAMFEMDGSPLAGMPRLPHIELVKPAEVSNDVKEKDEKPKIREISEDERQQIMSTDQFQRFFDRTSKIIERALTEEIDIFVDYAGEPDDHEKVDTGARLSLNRQFFDDKWTKGRCVTCLDWSLQHPELLLASYSRNEEMPHEPDGTVLIWNTKFKKDTPEYVFHSQSRVVSCAFGKFHPNLILGGTYSGQICLWDNRYNKKTPVQKSPLQTMAHTHPVFCLQVVGTQNAHNLVSLSTDGKLCSWSLDMLSQPQDSLELQLKQSKQVAVTCVSFPLNDVNNFVVGSEDGSVYTASRHGSKQGINDSFDGHCAPVTGVDCHAAQGVVDFSHLFLTSSFDWTVKLWSVKEQKPLYAFEDHQDYVLDVAWSPIHPSLFACVDTTGRLDLWNLNKDTEVPAAAVLVDQRPALNKVSWMPNGLNVVVGDDQGRLHVYEVNNELAVARADDWSLLTRSLADMQANQDNGPDAAGASGLR